MKGKIQYKKIIIDGIIGVLCIGLIIGIFAFLEHKTKSSEYDSNNEIGSISLKVYYKDDELVIDEKIPFTEGETIYHILNRTHSLECIDSVGVGKGILVIDQYKSNWYDNYFVLYVNGTYSSEGTEIIKAIDGMEIKLVWTDIK